MKFFSEQGETILDTVVDDNSYRHRAIMGDNQLVIHYSLVHHQELPVGTYCEFQGKIYTLLRPEAFVMQHTRKFEYTVTMEGEESLLRKIKLINNVDGRLKFTLTAKPHEHLQLLVDNLNNRGSGWSVGDCVESAEIMLSYNHNYCYDALTMLANALNTEFEIDNKRISVKKIEYNKDSPLALSYGAGKGLCSGVGRTNPNQEPITTLYVQGGSENIDRSKYGSSELHLPKEQTIEFDGEHFDTDDGFDENKARTYVVDKNGYSISRVGKTAQSTKVGAEDSYDATSIYPKREGTVSEVVVVDKDKNFYDIVDATIPETLDYSKCLMNGNKLTIIFQSGMLVSRKFDVNYYHESVDGKKARRFEIVPMEEDGMIMPSGDFIPKSTDKYAVFNCALPDAYICDNDKKTGAEWDMLRQAIRYMYPKEDVQFTFTGQMDGIWAYNNWEVVGGKILLGGYVFFKDDRFLEDGALVRIVGVKDYINKPHRPELELSNETITSGFSTTINELKGTEVIAEDYHRDSINFTKRRFRDAQETLTMLQDALLDNYTESISPITVQTMSMLVGDESLQFRFVDNMTNLTTIPADIEYDAVNKQLICKGGLMQHMTLGIKDISSAHDVDKYSFWHVEGYASPVLDDDKKKYYLYIKGENDFEPPAGDATFVLTESAIKMDSDADYYHFLVGILNSEYDNDRSFVTLYGYTEVLPGRVTTDRIVSSSGDSYFDMNGNAMKLGETLDFNTRGDGVLRLKGTLVQSQGGNAEFPIGCYRGAYDAKTRYYVGDEVTYKSSDGITATYRCIVMPPSAGIPPTNTKYWIVVAAGSKGIDAIQPNTSFKSTIFIRSNYNPGTPTGGDYANPVADGWYDGIPNGEEMLWASTRIFSSDGKAPQQDAWTTPQIMTDTATLDVEFSSVENPSAPENHPNTNPQWSNNSNEDTIWMAISQKSNGWWSNWEVQKIKGENGEDGKSINIKGTLESTSDLPIPPASPSDCYIIDDHLWVWDGDSWVDGGQFTGSDGENAFVHVKYAKSSTKNDWSDNNGETPDKYIGIYCDNNPSDQLVWNLYTWSKWQGEDGFGYEYIYKRTSDFVAPSTPTSVVQNDDYVPTGWCDDPPSVSETNRYCWMVYRKKTEGKWSRFYGTAGNIEEAALFTIFALDGQDGQDGLDGQDGQDGKDGQYTEYRYAKNGSTTTPPTIDTTARRPTGWTTAMPTLNTAEYLWFTSAVIRGDGLALEIPWSEPKRFTPVDGKDGDNGKSPAMVFRGDYKTNETYYGNEYRLDCVRYNGVYYIARIDAGEFSYYAPSAFSTKWNSFGATFDSVATELLLAENANIAGWVFRNNRLESADGKVYLDGNTGEVRLDGTLQFKTGLDGEYTDTNLFYLPSTTTTNKSITIGRAYEDAGKVIRLFNSSPFSGGIYSINIYTFTAKPDGNITSSYAMTVLLKPQETVELTCFEKAKQAADGTKSCEWQITSRFTQQDFLSSGAIGRYPRMIAIGHLNGAATTASTTITGQYFDGRDLSLVFNKTRLKEGYYQISFTSGLLGSNYWVIPWGFGLTKDQYANPTSATIMEKQQSYFIIAVTDDETPNDGDFEFLILSDNWWYPNIK